MVHRATLLALLAPFTIFSNTTSKNSRIQQLESYSSAKKLEISTKGKAVAEQEDLIENITSESLAAHAKLYASLNEQEKTEFLSEMTDFGKRLDRVIEYKEDIQQFLLQELSYNKKNNLEMGRIKLTVTRVVMESYILHDLIEDYGTCIQELFVVEHELNELLAA